MTSAVEEQAIKQEDWTSPVSSHKRSCLRLNTVEPCVNKAVFHLEALRQRLLEQEKPTRGPKQTSIPKERQDVGSPVFAKESRSATPKPPLESQSTTPGRPDVSQKSSVIFDSSELFVRGTKTGNERESRRAGVSSLPWLDAEDIILGAVDLVARLEQDRQEALCLLASEKARVCQLCDTLDVEAEKRLNLLPGVVQEGRSSVVYDRTCPRTCASLEPVALFPGLSPSFCCLQVTKTGGISLRLYRNKPIHEDMHKRAS